MHPNVSCLRHITIVGTRRLCVVQCQCYVHCNRRNAADVAVCYKRGRQMRTFTWIYTVGLALIVVNSVRRSVSGESTDLGRLRAADFHQTNPTTLCAPVSTTKITAVTMPVWSAHPVFAIHTNIVSAVTASTATSVPIATMSDFAPMFLRIFDLVAQM